MNYLILVKLLIKKKVREKNEFITLFSMSIQASFESCLFKLAWCLCQHLGVTYLPLLKFFCAKKEKELFPGHPLLLAIMIQFILTLDSILRFIICSLLFHPFCLSIFLGLFYLSFSHIRGHSNNTWHSRAGVHNSNLMAGQKKIGVYTQRPNLYVFTH